MIGDGRSAALISNRGSIDWLCWPRFDSAAIFAAILDPRIGGRWQIRPLQNGTTARQYLDRTNVLETIFTTVSGTLVLTDFMPVASEEQMKKQLWPEHEIVRHIRCERGAVDLRVDFNPRPDYGRINFAIKDRGRLGWRIELGSNLYTLQSEVALVRQGDRLSADCTLHAGEEVAFSFCYSAEAPAVIPPVGDLVARKLNLTTEWWRRWASQSNYRGRYERQVTRSALALKLLCYRRGGGAFSGRKLRISASAA